MKVFAFDRDETVDTNPPKGRKAVPLSWVRHLAHETHHEVWAIGNQLLRGEADIPGVSEAFDRLPSGTTKFGDPAVGIPREKRVQMLSVLFPEAEAYIVVDDVNLKHLNGWRHYFPWEFVDAVEGGDLDLPLPDEGLASD